MSRTARRTATYEDLVALPDNVIGELLGGELTAAPRPSVPHSAVLSELGAALLGPFRHGVGGPGGWWILDEPELHLASDVLVPDLAGWRRERLPKLPDAPALTLAPDWICEILSKSTAGHDRLRKLPRYAQAAVQHAWLLDPAQHLLEIYRLEAGHFALVGGAEGTQKLHAEPFDAIELDLGQLWPDT